MIVYDKLYIGGHWTDPTDPQLLDIRSPHDRSLLGRAAQATTADVDKAVAAAREAFDHGPWSRTTPEERQAFVVRLNELRAGRAKEIAARISAETGAALWFAEWGQPALDKQADAYLRAARSFGWEEPLDPTGASGSLVRREPIGVVAAVIPWNSPYMAALVKMIPALLAGNTVVLKASPENSLSVMLLAEIFDELGLPEGVVSILPADRATSEHLVSHPDVDKIAFTGSTAAGRRIASIAGEQLKRVSLELGGKSASIICEDADLTAMADGLKFASFANNSQNCQAHTRILAPRSRYDEVVGVLKDLVESLTVGDPTDPDTFIGPMTSEVQQQRVLNYIRIGIDEGARLVTGGPGSPEGLEGGNYVRPTLFADVDNGMRIAREEIFGPVIAVIPYEDEEDAVRIANDSAYGLGGGVWSTDPERALALARRVRTGFFMVNAAPVGFDGPFGGYKASGIGREMGAFGLAEFVELKTINV
ncbi:aldehyde dehydrogenase [Streptomyces sp. NPDC058614]|uniref:aldehyde dehydrogenase n=1 Tax=Streptomyces sp. NPDC058614 TaxID=3346557 RepID=UPI003646767D